jgi:hypothetical protein
MKIIGFAAAGIIGLALPGLPAAKAQERAYVLTLTNEQATEVMNAIQELPKRRADPLWNIVVGQIAEQNAKWSKDHPPPTAPQVVSPPPPAPQAEEKK